MQSPLSLPNLILEVFISSGPLDFKSSVQTYKSSKVIVLCLFLSFNGLAPKPQRKIRSAFLKRVLPVITRGKIYFVGNCNVSVLIRENTGQRKPVYWHYAVGFSRYFQIDSKLLQFASSKAFIIFS